MTATSTAASAHEHDDEPIWFPAKETLDELKKDFVSGQALSDLPPELPVSQIIEHPELFQPRELDERHIHELRRAIRVDGVLDAVTVIQVGGKAILIDGHQACSCSVFPRVTRRSRSRSRQGKQQNQAAHDHVRTSELCMAAGAPWDILKEAST